MINSNIKSDSGAIIEETFFTETRSAVSVEIYENLFKITFLNDREENELNYEIKDVIGCYIEEPYALNDKKVTLNIFIFAKQDSNKRKKITLRLIYDKYKKKSLNLKKMVDFKKNIDQLIEKEDKRAFLVFVNPNSGSGKASRLMLNQVIKIWRLANVKFRIIETSISLKIKVKKKLN